MYVFNYLLIGDTGVGKTTLVHRLLRREVATDSSKYTPTKGCEFATTTLRLSDARDVKVNIWDMSGNPIYLDLLKEYCRNICGVFLVYDVNNPESFDHIMGWYKKIKEYLDQMVSHGKATDSDLAKGPVFFLVGNKSDVSPHRVHIDSAKDLAQRYNWLFMEVSVVKSPMMARQIFCHLSENIYHEVTENAYGLGISVETPLKTPMTAIQQTVSDMDGVDKVDKVDSVDARSMNNNKSKYDSITSSKSLKEPLLHKSTTSDDLPKLEKNSRQPSRVVSFAEKPVTVDKRYNKHNNKHNNKLRLGEYSALGQTDVGCCPIC